MIRVIILQDSSTETEGPQKVQIIYLRDSKRVRATKEIRTKIEAALGALPTESPTQDVSPRISSGPAASRVAASLRSQRSRRTWSPRQSTG